MSNTNQLVVEIEVYNDSLIKGTSRLEYERDKFEHYVIKGVYNTRDSTIYFSEEQEIEVNPGLLANTVMGNYTMKLKMYDTVMRMEGKWRQNGNGLLTKMATRVWLEKSIKKSPPAKTVSTASASVQPDPVGTNNTTTGKKKERETIIQRQIEIDTIEQDSIRIDIIDNARIDNDIISLYLDDSLVAHKQLISKVPLTFYFSLNNTPVRTIKLVAESYGSMPPCTAHMRVITCKSIHTFDLRSTYQTNAAVEFYLKGTRVD